MNASPITAVLLPLALAFIMLYLGSTLQWTDFRAVLRRPRALAVGLVGQMLLLPALAWGVATGLGLDPVMAVGLMVLAACPGGVSSGLLTHLADGDVALSIALTAVTSVAAMFTLPLLLDASLQHFLGRGLEVQMPLGGMVRSMFLLTTLPVLLGMALRGMAQRAGRVEGEAREERGIEVGNVEGLALQAEVGELWIHETESTAEYGDFGDGRRECKEHAPGDGARDRIDDALARRVARVVRERARREHAYGDGLACERGARERREQDERGTMFGKQHEQHSCPGGTKAPLFRSRL